MVYKIPGTESDPDIPQPYVDIAIETTKLAPGHRAIAYLAHLLWQRDRLQEEVDKSMLDVKTGVLKDEHYRRYLEDALLGLREDRRRHNRANSCLVHIYDLVDFKQVNSKFGHQGGDLRLKAVGEVLKSIVRTDGTDLVGRIGGDEFSTAVFYDRDEISEKNLLLEIERRLSDPVLFEKFEYMTPLRWNHAFFTGSENAEELLKVADVKGEENYSWLVRAHGQPEGMRERLLSLAWSIHPHALE
jgi:diguanylate cyclase (GGDEF)-like protein